MSSCLIVLVSNIGYHCYRVKMSKQILNQEKVLEIHLSRREILQENLNAAFHRKST